MSDKDQVYHPNMTEKIAGNGLQCFLNMDRPCGPDCMAYVNPPIVKGPDYDGKQWANCLLLTSSQQISKHIVAIANILKPKIGLGNPPVPR